MGIAPGTRYLALGAIVTCASLGLGGFASAASPPMVQIDQSSLSVPAIGANHYPFGPLTSGQTLAEVFTTTQAFSLVGACTPTWTTKTSGGTLTLRQGAGLTGTVLAQHAFTNVVDGAFLTLSLTRPAPAGVYTLELSDPTGPSPLGSPPKGGAIGWWGANAMVSGDYALINGKKEQDELVTEYQPLAATSATTGTTPTTSPKSALPKTGGGPTLPLAGLAALGAGLRLLVGRRRVRRA